MENLSDNYFQVSAIILFGIGFSTLLMNSNIIKKIIGMNIMDTGIFLLFISMGYIDGRKAPILDSRNININNCINPLPSALILTGIVVAISISAIALAIGIRLYREYGTFDLDQMRD